MPQDHSLQVVTLKDTLTKRSADYNRIYVPLRNISREENGQPITFEVSFEVSYQPLLVLHLYLKRDRFLSVKQKNVASVGTKLLRQAGQSSADLGV